MCVCELVSLYYEISMVVLLVAQNSYRLVILTCSAFQAFSPRDEMMILDAQGNVGSVLVISSMSQIRHVRYLSLDNEECALGHWATIRSTWENSLHSFCAK